MAILRCLPNRRFAAWEPRSTDMARYRGRAVGILSRSWLASAGSRSCVRSDNLKRYESSDTAAKVYISASTWSNPRVRHRGKFCRVFGIAGKRGHPYGAVSPCAYWGWDEQRRFTAAAVARAHRRARHPFHAARIPPYDSKWGAGNLGCTVAGRSVRWVSGRRIIMPPSKEKYVFRWQNVLHGNG